MCYAFPRMPTQEERSEVTRGKLLDAARRLFRTRGYPRTSIEEIASRAGLTKGAFYHHFEDKRAIFLAVFEETERRLMETATAGIEGGDAWRRLRAGCRAFLEACLDPGVQRIVLRDAPVVLGWETWREIDTRYSLGLIEAGLTEAMSEGLIRQRPPGPLAHLLFGALCEGVMMIARSAKPREALAEVVREIDQLLGGLRPASRDRSTRG